MNRIDTFLQLVVNQNGSDLHLVAGNPPRIRLYGELFPVKYRELTRDETADLILDTMSATVRQAFESRHGLDYAYEVAGLARFRVNAFRHLGGLGAVFRVIRTTIRTLDELAMPAVLKTFCKQKRGLILVTGPTGSGKSTTLAAMVDFINQDRKEHLITIEDPVEFIHPQKNCLISQREIGLNADSFAGALRSSLREDANVVLVGELRDLETIGLAVTAAETGLLVLATLHTSGAAATVDRMVSVFPAGEQNVDPEHALDVAVRRRVATARAPDGRQGDGGGGRGPGEQRGRVQHPPRGQDRSAHQRDPVRGAGRHADPRQLAAPPDGREAHQRRRGVPQGGEQGRVRAVPRTRRRAGVTYAGTVEP